MFEMLPKDPNTAMAIATVASVIVASGALVVSVVSLFVASATLRQQRTHDVLSVRPIPIVTVADYENSLRIKLRNHGSGPLIVKRLHVLKGSAEKDSIIDWVPDLPEGLVWTHFAGPIENRSLLPGGEVPLLEFSEDGETRRFVKMRDVIRRELSQLTVTIRYTDIYGSEFSSYVQKLSWFGR